MEYEFGSTNNCYRNLANSIIFLKMGFMSVPPPITRSGEDTANKVNEFYHSEDIWRTLPGRHDTVNVRINGVKEKHCKKLVLLTFKEAHL